MAERNFVKLDSHIWDIYGWDLSVFLAYDFCKKEWVPGDQFQLWVDYPFNLNFITDEDAFKEYLTEKLKEFPKNITVHYRNDMYGILMPNIPIEVVET